jgi:hypothetical protein
MWASGPTGAALVVYDRELSTSSRSPLKNSEPEHQDMDKQNEKMYGQHTPISPRTSSKRLSESRTTTCRLNASAGYWSQPRVLRARYRLWQSRMSSLSLYRTRIRNHRGYYESHQDLPADRNDSPISVRRAQTEVVVLPDNVDENVLLITEPADLGAQVKCIISPCSEC